MSNEIVDRIYYQFLVLWWRDISDGKQPCERLTKEHRYVNDELKRIYKQTAHEGK